MKRTKQNFSKYDKNQKKRKIIIILAVFFAPVLILFSLLIASACQAQPLEVYDQGMSRSGINVFYDYGADPGITLDYAARSDNQGNTGIYGNINNGYTIIFADENNEGGEKITSSTYIYSGIGLNYGVVENDFVISNEVKLPASFHYDSDEGKVYIPKGVLITNFEFVNTFIPHILWNETSISIPNNTVNNSQVFYMSANTSLLIAVISFLAIISIVVGIKYFSLRKNVSFDKEYRPILQKALMFLAMTWFVRVITGEFSIIAKIVDFVKSIFMK